MSSTNDDDVKAFFESNKDFRLKLQLNGAEGSPTRKIRLEELIELSYKALCEMAIALTVSLEKEPPSLPPADYQVQLMYQDTQQDWILIATTKELVASVKELVHEGYMRIIANVKPRIQQRASIPPSPARLTAKKRKASPKKKKKSAPVARRVNVAPIPARVASMPAAVVNGNQEQDGGRRKARVDYVALNGGEVSASDDDGAYAAAAAAGVAIKQEPKDAGYEEGNDPEDEQYKEDMPQKKRARSDVRGKILMGLGELRALGMEEPLRVHVALSSGYENPQSLNFRKTLSQLKEEGMVDIRKGNLSLTQRGLGSLPAMAPVGNNAEAQMRLLALLEPKKKTKESEKADQIFEILRDGQIHDRKTVASAVGYSNVQSLNFRKAVSKLEDLQLIHFPNKSTLQLSDFLFPFGREEGN